MGFKNKKERAQYMKRWRKENKDKIQKYNREVRHVRLRQRRFDYKKAIMAPLGGKCSICGYSKNATALEFHHCTSVKERGMAEYLHDESKTRVEKEIKKCILVCANCHREIHNPDFDMK